LNDTKEESRILLLPRLFKNLFDKFEVLLDRRLVKSLQLKQMNKWYIDQKKRMKLLYDLLL